MSPRPSVRVVVRLMILVAAAECAHAQSLRIVSLAAGGVQANGHSGLPAISPDGKSVMFGSYASNLAPPGPPATALQIFVHELATGATTPISWNLAGAPGDQESKTCSLAAGGRFATFWSYATNLVRNDTNGVADVFVWERQTGALTRVSVSSLGQQADLWSDFPSITPDGRFVVFVSYATNLVPNDTNATLDVFVHDRQTRTTTRANLGLLGAEANDYTGQIAKISDDGRFVAFVSAATNLVPNDTNGVPDVFVRDRVAGTTQRVSVGPGGVQCDLECIFDVAISGNGRYVAFQSSATNLVLNDTNGYSDLFVHDRLTGTTTRENVTATGGQMNMSILFGLQMSFDGRFIAFAASDGLGVPAGANGYSDVYVRDRQTGALRCASLSVTGAEGNGASQNFSLSSDGRYIAFDSAASNLVPGDVNQASDTFLRDLGPLPTGTPFCFGDGTGAACPCTPVGGAGRGCPNSGFAAGALLGGSGNAGVLLGPDTLVLTATELTGTGLFIQGTAQQVLGLGTPFGDGLLCVAGTIVRLGVVSAIGGAAAYPNASTPVPIGIAGGPIASGATRYYQCWYRDAANFCQPTTFGLTQGLAVNWQ